MHFRFRTEEEEHITVDYIAVVQVGGLWTWPSPVNANGIDALP